MLLLLLFNLLLLVLAAAILLRRIPSHWFASLMDLLHNTIGITTAPTERQLRLALLLWIAFTLVIVDGTIYLIRNVF